MKIDEQTKMIGKALLRSHREHLQKVLGGQRLWEPTRDGKWYSVGHSTAICAARKFLSKFSDEEKAEICSGLVLVVGDAPSKEPSIAQLMRHLSKRERDEIIAELKKLEEMK